MPATLIAHSHQFIGFVAHSHQFIGFGVLGGPGRVLSPFAAASRGHPPGMPAGLQIPRGRLGSPQAAPGLFF